MVCRRSLLAALLVLCACPGVVAPGSLSYQPLPKYEAAFHEKARRDLFPNEVRQAPEAHQQTLVAWTGVITAIEEVPRDDGARIHFTVEHHYFDWIEDRGLQRERFFMSPRGEGTFKTGWVIEKPEDRTWVAQFAVGDMLVAYGYPALDRDSGELRLWPAMNLRAIKPELYRTDVLDYGPGVKPRILRVP